MISFNLIIERGANQSETDVNVPETMAEFTAFRYVQTLEIINGAPDWLQKYFALPVDQQRSAFSELGDAKHSEYLQFLLQVIGAATGVDISDLLALPMAEHDKSVIPLAYMVLNIIGGYKPVEMNEFSHKGKRYVFPVSVITEIGEFNQTTYGPNMKAGEVIEAMRRREIFGVRDESGNSKVKDGIYYSDLGMIASLARVKDANGQIEEPPLGLNEFSEFVNQRMNELKDLPADTFRNAAFFLINSSLRYVHTLTSDLSLKVRSNRPKTSKKPKGKGSGKRSSRNVGKHGVGTR